MKKFIHNFKGFDIHESSCEIIITSNNDKTFICFVDLGNGTNVTNANEQIATDIVNKECLNPLNCRFFETYKIYDYDDFDEIEYNWENNNGEWFADGPEWKPAPEIKSLFNLE